MTPTRVLSLASLLALVLPGAVHADHAEISDIITDDVSMPAACEPIPVVDVMHELIPVRRGDSAAKLLDGAVEAIESSPKHDGRRVAVRRELFDGHVLAAQMYADAVGYANACTATPKACAALEAAVVELYAESLGHQLHVAAVTTAPEHFVTTEESKSGARVRLDLEPSAVQPGAWFPARKAAVTVPVVVDFAFAFELPYLVRDVHVAGRSLSDSLREHAGDLAGMAEESPGPFVNGEAIFTKTWFAQRSTLEAIDDAWKRLPSPKKG